MKKKLTLKLDEKVIERARVYAKQRKVSLSNLVETYFRYLTSTSIDEEEEISPLVKSLSGIVDASIVSEPHIVYKKYIGEKYSQ